MNCIVNLYGLSHVSCLQQDDGRAHRPVVPHVDKGTVTSSNKALSFSSKVLVEIFVAFLAFNSVTTLTSGAAYPWVQACHRSA